MQPGSDQLQDNAQDQGTVQDNAQENAPSPTVLTVEQRLDRVTTVLEAILMAMMASSHTPVSAEQAASLLELLHG